MKPCEICKRPFAPATTTQRICSPRCAVKFAKLKEAERKAKEKARVEKARPLRWYLRRTERAVNAFVRRRDTGKPCISCGRYVRLTAGHYISVGHGGSALRFELDNLHGQCVQDNVYRGGRVAQYRIGLIARIGQARVDWLEGPHAVKKWTREELTELWELYK